MAPPRRLRGAILVLAGLVLLLAIGALFAAAATFELGAARSRVTERALAQAREALVAYAADRPVNSTVGPGYLPCPDLDNDGWAESTCGSQDGSSGQAERLGRLPWKTLGLPDLRDGDGERLWYAVSSKYKGLLNCGISRACIDMTPPAALGTITVRDPSGRPVHDGTLASAAHAEEGGAVAVVIAPGAALARIGADGSRVFQRRECAPGACDADGRCLPDPPQLAAPCNPANYLDRAPLAGIAEDNADFVDRNDAVRAGNANGFIAGPVRMPDGDVAVNDRIVALTYGDVMPSIMRRVALEVLHCLRDYAAKPENAGRYPWPAASCREGAAFGNAPDVAGALLGSAADTPFARTADASGGRMLERWWRSAPRVPENLAELPTRTDACRLAIAPDEEAPPRTSAPGAPATEGETAGDAGNAWWTPWLPFVSYALAPPFTPSAPGTPDCAAGACIEIDDAPGHAIARDKEVAVIVSASCGAAPQCDVALGCTHIVVDPAQVNRAIAAYP
jgi:hypothetical protein